MALKKNIIQILIISAVIIVSAILLRDYIKSTDVTYSYYINNISEFMDNKDYKKAVDECNNALKKFPSQSEIYIIKAEAYYLEGNILKALGTIDYGYKTTGDSKLKEYREKYDKSEDNSAEFSEVQNKADVYQPESKAENEIYGNEVNEGLGYGSEYVFPEFPYAEAPEIVTQPSTEALTDSAYNDIINPVS